MSIIIMIDVSANTFSGMIDDIILLIKTNIQI